ncbi:MAG TPA: tRNA preQ1(34) S-adenosylmethionine ribosyltransferase-isomerase QueA [Steroidobacteraceae bacterium]|nr:tRNA preQ1(34) S-adenosylmethionine ribosyltransferase-isomerase QueA [Steroidobacteraceae bacterium]
MQRSDFLYELPAELIAQEPLPQRSASRLLVLERAGQGATDRRDAGMRDLPELLARGDLLVFNDTRVIAARLLATKPSGGRVEILLERALDSHAALVQLRASKPVRPPVELLTAGGTVHVLGREGDLWHVRLPRPALEFFERWGEVPLPPYIRRPPAAADRERYQSVLARVAGAVAAPTASLHFDAALLAALARAGIERTCITLHVGAGTFQPLRSERLEEHVMHAEQVSVGAAACEAIARTRARGGRVIAVGTTVVRALESAAAAAGSDAAAASLPQPWSGETRLFIVPGYRFAVVDGLLTNFHLPGSTLLMLVCALAGRERVLAAYAHAVRSRYRFFSYGDAMLIRPPQAPLPDATVL